MLLHIEVLTLSSLSRAELRERPARGPPSISQLTSILLTDLTRLLKSKTRTPISP